MAGPDPGEAARAVAAGSRSVALWTLIGRGTGFLRVATIAAVLGPTFFGNLFQTALLVPYTLSELLAGSLIPSLIAPRLVRVLADGDRPGAERLAADFMRAVVMVLAVVALVAALAAPAIATLATLAVADAGVRARQAALAVPLILTLLPQVVLDGVAAVAVGAQVARRRFVLPTALPILENLGLVATLLTTGAVFGIAREVDGVSLAEVLVLGLGATTAAAVHAVAQVWGARRAGFRLFKWSRGSPLAALPLLTAAVLSSGTAGLNSAASLALVTAAGSVPGGAIAFQIAQYLLNVPVGLGVRSIAVVQLPHLAEGGAGGRPFVETYRGALRLALFLALPVAVLCAALPRVLADGFAFGGMSTADGRALVAAAILGLAPGILAEAIFVLSVSASYARLDARTPLAAMAVRVLVSAVGIGLSFARPAPAAFVLSLALTFSVSAAAGAAVLAVRDSAVRGALAGLNRWLPGELAASVAAALPPTALALWVLPSVAIPGPAAAAGLVGLTAALYLIIQLARRSPELRLVFAARQVRLAGADAGPE